MLKFREIVVVFAGLFVWQGVVARQDVVADGLALPEEVVILDKPVYNDVEALQKAAALEDLSRLALAELLEANDALYKKVDVVQPPLVPATVEKVEVELLPATQLDNAEILNQAQQKLKTLEGLLIDIRVGFPVGDVPDYSFAEIDLIQKINSAEEKDLLRALWRKSFSLVVDIRNDIDLRLDQTPRGQDPAMNAVNLEKLEKIKTELEDLKRRSTSRLFELGY